MPPWTQPATPGCLESGAGKGYALSVQPQHRAWAEIDLAAFRSNLAAARARAGDAQVWPVLKANAYGHGALPVALACGEEGVPRIGVGDSAEALQLRLGGVRTPLLVLGTVIDAEVPDLLEHDVEVGVHSEGRARTLGALAMAAGRRLGVHLKVDTGMARLGVRPEAVRRVAEAIRDQPGLELRGLMTHYSSTVGCDAAATSVQAGLFAEAAREVRAALGFQPMLHAANSAVLYSGAPPFGDAVRPGIALFGIAAGGAVRDAGLEPVLSLRTQVVFLKDLPAGQPVGYDGRWKAPAATRIATLPIGYNDGVPWRLGAAGGGEVLLRGRRCPMVGAVSMDYVTVEVGHVPGVDIGDVATLIGVDGDQRIRAEDVARAAGTIPYEITCSIGARVHRLVRDQRPAPAAQPVSAVAR